LIQSPFVREVFDIGCRGGDFPIKRPFCFISLTSFSMKKPNSGIVRTTRPKLMAISKFVEMTAVKNFSKTSSIPRHQKDPKKPGITENVNQIRMSFQKRTTTVCEDFQVARKEFDWCSVPFQKVRTVRSSINVIAGARLGLRDANDWLEQLGPALECLGMD
jgi:hypothetical protein